MIDDDDEKGSVTVMLLLLLSLSTTLPRSVHIIYVYREREREREMNYYGKEVGLTADSVEFHPIENDWFACSTYQIDQQHDLQYKERRSGILYLFKIERDQETTGAFNFVMKCQVQFDSGILDAKWSRSQAVMQRQKESVLAVVLSRGDIRYFKLLEDNTAEGEYKLDEVPLITNSQYRISKGDDILALSIDWNNKDNDTTNNDNDNNNNKIVSSFSDGSLAVLKNGNQMVHRWKAHGYEAWIAAYNYHDSNFVMSGGDDCLFKSWDLRMINQVDPEDDEIEEGVTAISQKRCEMGVTSIHCHPSKEHIVAQGSYDEKLRIWDLRSMRAPLSITDSLGGGVWRVKWHPTDSNRLVTACMSGGFHIVHYENDDYSSPTVQHSYNGDHKSIAYGVDWSSLIDDQYIGCCSFYDKYLSIWKPF
ncbi:WD40 repeat-containing protein [Cavenderia fasciculata]|uniref:methylated diphthine methylhydrolase n=1 Tax=Cavenderia fasciculata TaxID=261658 RepID=F4PLV0_CACFS|nr:WD40 repeat-containing protein [Cavenderia fasciculata]EGG23504.1 WD40 repeat-containing protein [Cavenderia fasciculata]|eukprot:XP_004361355.1 WD40 repeat-containing protein [Cavenderia fasciculata]